MYYFWLSLKNDNYYSFFGALSLSFTSYLVYSPSFSTLAYVGLVPRLVFSGTDDADNSTPLFFPTLSHFSSDGTGLGSGVCVDCYGWIDEGRGVSLCVLG